MEAIPPTKTCDDTPFGITITSDICNITTHKGLLNHSDIPIEDLGAEKTFTRQFAFASELEFDITKKVIGFEVENISYPFTVKDTCGNDISLSSPFQNQNLKALVKCSIWKK